jgi:hypothetical protein
LRQVDPSFDEIIRPGQPLRLAGLFRPPFDGLRDRGFNMVQRRAVAAMAAAAAAAAVLGGGFAATPARAGFADMTAARDSTIFAPDFGLVSNGAGDAIFAGKTNNGSIRRALVYFDLQASLPTNAVVNTASVSMFSTNALLPSSVFLHRALANWGEGTSSVPAPRGGQGTTPTPDDVTWIDRFYAANPAQTWTTPGGDYAPAATASVDNVQYNAFDFVSSANLVADVQNWISNPASNFGWAVLGDESGSATAKRIASRENSVAANRPRLLVDYSASTWKNGAGGAWSAAGNWDFGVPDAAGAEANFSFAVPGNPAAVVPVNVDGGKIAGVLNFTSPNSYVLSGSILTLDRAAGRNVIDVDNGNHRVAAPLRLNRSTNVDLSAGSSFTAEDLSAAGGVAVEKLGAGTFTANNVRLDNLTLTEGRVVITPSGGAAIATSTLNSLVIGNGQFDLRDNKLVTSKPVGTFTAGAYDGVHGDVARAYNSGAWNQSGLMTSEPNAGPTIGTTTLGVATAQSIMFLAPTATGTWSGQPVTGATTLVMYTYAGDLNFDGRVDAQDYGIIDNWVQFPGTSGYANGDINYDGVIDAADYGIIDNTIQLQGAPIPSGTGAVAMGMAGVRAVPEPSSVTVLLLSPLLSLARRQRGRARHGDV